MKQTAMTFYLADVQAMLGKFIRVENMCSPNSGNCVENQFRLFFEHGTVFQSYNTIVAVRLDGYHDITDADGKERSIDLFVNDDSITRSKTTSKYLKEFCGYTRREIDKAVEEDERVAYFRE